MTINADDSDDESVEALYAFENAPNTPKEVVHGRSNIIVQKKTTVLEEKAVTSTGADGTRMMDTTTDEGPGYILWR